MTSPIVQYWHSSQIPGEVAELIASFRDHNPDLNHLVFDEAKAEAFIAEHLTAREVAAFRSCAVPAMQADYFRYCAVLTLGGIYSDADFRCRRPLSGLLDTAGDGLLFQNSLGHIVNGFLIFPTIDHPLPQLALDVATENIERRAADKIYMVTGPWVLSMLRALREKESLEVARREVAGDQIEQLACCVIDAVGDYSRLREAFDQVRIAPLSTAWDWIAKPEERPRYKESGDHWETWHQQGREIFR